MINDQLSDYIKNQLEQGKSKDVIKNELLGVGWKGEDIDNALGVSSASSVSSFISNGKQKLQPNVVWIFFLRIVVVNFILSSVAFLRIGITLFEKVSTGLIVWLIYMFVVVIVAWFWARLSYDRYFFEFKDVAFYQERGVLYKNYISIPYNRIQNIDIHRGILDRMLGLSRLIIQTAGHSRFGSEGSLPGLSPEYAEKLRTDLMSHARQLKKEGFN